MSGWSAARTRWTMLVYTGLVVALAWWYAWRPGSMFTQADTAEYLAMAEGKPAMLPFASRPLGPMIVRGLMHLHLSLHSAFVLEGVVALVFFAAATAFIVIRSGAPQWTLPAVGGMLFWGVQLNALVMPDLLYAALMCCFLLLLRANRVMAACLMMFPMTISRESTMLTLVCFLLVGWRRLRWTEAAAAVLATGAGMAVVKRLSANALPNMEHISPVLYLAAKMPWNFLKNVLGLGMWANFYRICEEPKWKITVHLGPLKEVGACGYYPMVQAETFGIALMVFGLLPLILLRVRGRLIRSGGREDLLMRFAILYGGVSFLLAPLLGESFLRLYAYAWPLFLVALPVLLAECRATFTSGWAALLFLALHLFLAWSFLWAFPLYQLQTGLVCFALGWLLLHRTFRVGLGAGPGAAHAGVFPG